MFSGVCAVMAASISFFLIYKHAQFYTKPNQQRYIIRIVLMVPIYAVISWLSYRFYQESIYFEVIRDCYEAFVLASFFILLLQYLGDTGDLQREAIQKRPQNKLVFPLCCWTYNPASPHFLQWLKWGILQYVVIRPITTSLSVIFMAKGSLCPESLSPKYGRVYILAIEFTSVSIAMYCLVIFYMTVCEEIQQFKPFYKFLCIKLVIFFSFWQYVFLSVLVQFGRGNSRSHTNLMVAELISSALGIIKETEYWTEHNISTGVQAILICVEMVFFSFLHVKAFDYRGYRPKGRDRLPVFRALVDALNPMDFVREIYSCIVYFFNCLTGSHDNAYTRNNMDIHYAMGISSNRSSTSMEAADAGNGYLHFYDGSAPRKSYETYQTSDMEFNISKARMN
ncbi:DUF300-domain-containing protein [Basidiobolus meristosporus CBS 931.73]|uniref:DUF300-domain-containing protein n=1 Tax=Basidiobolus meristosporus CBS 931.73 TaxID=1314790 RepID=A0A1Y1YYR6_9FUNG|nr:DUF300-domain-containing protein [Basidiobolus meristosporus CBS 931.73]|eukprot:ORY02715.1 DUF300-domain-containing protein [Basidiobolus meristosporus CBS 931.73]